MVNQVVFQSWWHRKKTVVYLWCLVPFFQDMIKLLHNDKNEKLTIDKKESLKAEIERLIEKLCLGMNSLKQGT